MENYDKLDQRVIDFENLPAALAGIKADHGFCCLGTTIKTAGSKEKQHHIDHDYVIEFAKACHIGGVSKFAVVSSIGANASSSNFYLRTKGEMEPDLQKIIRNFLLFVGLILISSLWSCNPDREKCKQEIVQTERDFAKMAAEKGVAEAFSFYVADSGVVNIREKLFRGRVSFIRCGNARPMDPGASFGINYLSDPILNAFKILSTPTCVAAW